MPTDDQWNPVDSFLIRSGQGEVSRVCRLGDERVYALKRLLGDRSTERFAREIRTMKELYASGVAVPPVIDDGIDNDGRPWFVMPWFEPGHLRLQDPSRTQQESFRYLLSIASTVAEIHAKGLAHRDLKPENLLLDGSKVLVADFGLTRSIEDPRLTRVSEIVGPEFYMAPEVEGGQHPQGDQRAADFYSFGKLAWAILSKRRALPRENHCEYKNSLEHVLNNSLYRTVDRLLERLAEKEPGSRETEWPRVMEEINFACRDIFADDPAPRRSGLDVDSILSRGRRLGAGSPVSSIQKELADRERQAARKQRFLMILTEHLGEPLKPIVAELNQELRNFANFNLSMGQTNWQGNMEVARLFGPVLQAVGGPFSIINTTCSLFALICTAELRPQRSSALIVAAAYTNETAWLLRAVFLRSGDPPHVNHTLLDDCGFTCVEGPLGLDSPSTERKMSRFVEEAVRASGRFIEKSMTVMEEGAFLISDPNSWAADTD